MLSQEKKETKCRDIIVQFADKETKDTFQKERKKLSSCKDSNRRVFINDDLTEYRQKLLYDARQVVNRVVRNFQSRRGSEKSRGRRPPPAEQSRPVP